MFDEVFVSWFLDQIDCSAGPDGCWYFRGYKGGNYIGVYYQGRTVGTAHKIACILAHGPVPDPLVVMHSCDNRPCCNPAHLRMGTYKENSQDMMRKGRQRGGYGWVFGHGGDLN